jgi:hypothetical protein
MDKSVMCGTTSQPSLKVWGQELSLTLGLLQVEISEALDRERLLDQLFS